MNPPVWSFRNWEWLQWRWLQIGSLSLLTCEAGLDMVFDVFEKSRPVVGGRDFHVGFKVGVVAAKDAVVSFAESFFTVFLW
jgi:hypothetical protein